MNKNEFVLTMKLKRKWVSIPNIAYSKNYDQIRVVMKDNFNLKSKMLNRYNYKNF